ncbi:MAG TPA: thiosulfate reductase [Desulfocapsa sulfexigens]|nr:thiosulfate reductase [Desulfocapsa sulfexigens]
MKKSVYSICGMCAVRCPVRVEVEDGKVTWIEGNSNDGGMGKAVCAKAAASIPFQYDDQRPQSPMIRDGARGSGKWKSVSWDEAYDYITDKLKGVISEHGAKSIMLTDRGGPFADLRKAFMKAVGSPNYINHDCTCGRNANHACKSTFGMGRTGFAYDLKNAKHIVLFGRNITESFKIKEVRNFMKAVKNGAHVTYVDPRVTNTASKATRYWQNIPGTDYALLLGITNYILENKFFDEAFVKKWCSGLKELKAFVKEYTPEWAEKETGISAEEIKDFCKEVNDDRPGVIFHIGWLYARYTDTFYASRMLNILNALMGNVEQTGGLIFPKTPKHADLNGLKSLGADIPSVDEPRCDSCDSTWSHFDNGAGMLQLAYDAIDTSKPYPVKAYFVHRHNPLIALPDPKEQKRILDKLDLLVSVDVNYSETSWYADVILPESTFLERDSILRTEKGPRPGFGMRRKCVEPLYDSKPGWQIYVDLAERLGKGEYFPYKSIEDIWNYQLQDTDVKIEDFDEKGFVKLCDDAIGCSDDNIEFGTESGKIEFINNSWEEKGIVCFKPYESPEKPPEGSYRLLFGRKGYQTHGQSCNNPVLSQLLGKNKLLINTAEAEKMGISDGDMVTITNQGTQGEIEAQVTDFIHPEAVFMLHGFGTDVPAQERAFGKGLADNAFMKGKLKDWDPAGGGLALNESFVTVKPAA